MLNLHILYKNALVNDLKNRLNEKNFNFSNDSIASLEKLYIKETSEEKLLKLKEYYQVS